MKVIGLSVDSTGDHEGWARDIEETQGQAPNYPIIGDHDFAISKLYGMLGADVSGDPKDRTAADNQTVRNVFVIGPDKKVKLVLIYPMTTGRNFDEVLRVIDSLQLTARHRVSTPVNWQQGDDVIIAGSVSNDEAKEIFGDWEEPKPYIRIVPQPQLISAGFQCGPPDAPTARADPERPFGAQLPLRPRETPPLPGSLTPPPSPIPRGFRLLGLANRSARPSYPWGVGTNDPEGRDDVHAASTHGGARRAAAPPRWRSGSRWPPPRRLDARGQATAIGLIATMNASSEVPAPAGDVSGAPRRLHRDRDAVGRGRTLQWQMTFSGLTGPGTAAHIHVATRGQAGPVVVPLCGPARAPRAGQPPWTRRCWRRSSRAARTSTSTRTRTRRARSAVRSAWPRRCRQRSHVAAGGAAAEGERPACRRLVRRDRHDGGDDRLRSWRLTFTADGSGRRSHPTAGRGAAGPLPWSPLCGPCRSGQRGSGS